MVEKSHGRAAALDRTRSGTADASPHLLRDPGYADFEQMEALEARCYDPCFITPAAEAYAWYLRCPESTVALACAGRVVGLANLMPVDDEVFAALRAGTFNDAEMTADQMLTPAEVLARAGERPAGGGQPACTDQPARAHMFLSCIAVDEAWRGRGLARVLLREAAERYRPIEHLVDAIVTDNVTPDGERLSRRLGFAHVCASDHGSQVYARDYQGFVRLLRTY